MDLSFTQGSTLKIAYIGNFSPNSVGEPEIANSLEELGHKVIRINEFSISLKEVENIAKESDLLLFAKFRVGEPSGRLELIKRFPSVCWIFDLFAGLTNDEAI